MRSPVLSRRVLARSAVALAVTSALMGCPEKKVEPPPAPAPVAVKPPPPPPPPVEPRAEKECAAPVDPGPVTDVKFGERTAKLAGAKLTFSDKDADGALVLGVLGPINEDSGANLLALRKYVKFFKDEKADAIIVTGDVGETAASITRALNEVAGSKLPVFVVIGNRECRAEFTDGVDAANKANGNVINMNAVRVVEFPELTLVSLPGYHDPNYINCKTGCQYLKSTIDDVVRVAKAAQSPVALVAHGPPHGSGAQAVDYTSAGANVGDPAVAKLLGDAAIPFGFFSNIKEAGGRAGADPESNELVKEGVASKKLYLNPGPADTVGWDMNDGTKNVGMAAVFTLKDAQGSYKLLRLKPMTAAEKAEAKKLEPAAPAKDEGAAAPK